MAKVGKIWCKLGSRYPLRSHTYKNMKNVDVKKKKKKRKKQYWENAICSVCMEVPHNAVLLLCLSYNKGCRPFMCDTSRRYSNCLEQYTKNSNDNKEVPEFLCPLCRMEVKGWTVIEAARKFLNRKKRSCIKDDCCFVGTYKNLRKHVRSKHPFARSWEVDPVRQEEWIRLLRDILRNEFISFILSSVPGAMVMGNRLLVPDGNDSFYAFHLATLFVPSLP